MPPLPKKTNESPQKITARSKVHKEASARTKVVKSVVSVVEELKDNNPVPAAEVDEGSTDKIMHSFNTLEPMVATVSPKSQGISVFFLPRNNILT